MPKLGPCPSSRIFGEKKIFISTNWSSGDPHSCTCRLIRVTHKLSAWQPTTLMSAWCSTSLQMSLLMQTIYQVLLLRAKAQDLKLASSSTKAKSTSTSWSTVLTFSTTVTLTYTCNLRARPLAARLDLSTRSSISASGSSPRKTHWFTTICPWRWWTMI